MGIVLDVDPDAHHPVVVSLVPGKAADGCKRIGVGDKLVAVAGQPTQGKTFNEVRDLIVGPVGSTVTLDFRGVAGEYKCDLVRGSVHPPQPQPQPEFELEAEAPAPVRLARPAPLPAARPRRSPPSSAARIRPSPRSTSAMSPDTYRALAVEAAHEAPRGRASTRGGRCAGRRPADSPAGGDVRSLLRESQRLIIAP